MRSVRRRPGVACLGVVGVLLLTSFGAAEAATPSITVSTLAKFDAHISHIVFLMQENRAYDNFYGVYCATNGTYCPNSANAIPPNTCVPLHPGTLNFTCARPFNLTRNQLSLPDLPHDWYSTHTAYDGGYMNNFYAAEGSLQTFGHYNGSTLPVYWDLAEQYGLADDFFSSVMTYSLSNHWYMVASTTPSSAVKWFPPWAPVSMQHLYLNQSNATASIESELVNSSVSWKYYDFGLQKYNVAITTTSCCGGGSAYDLWNPLAARAQSYATKVRSHFVGTPSFFADARAGTLPNVSWIIPAGWQSDHAPANLSDGQNWTASVVNALESSPEWNSTVLFVSWDEYGGWYDHVRPPHLDALGDSFRVPMLAIGPWVKQGYVDHQRMDFGSVLHLMEERFNLTCLGPRDCHANVPLLMFNFNRPPRAPILIPTFDNASYPMPLQSSGKLPRFDPALVGPPPLTEPSGPAPEYIGNDED